MATYITRVTAYNSLRLVVVTNSQNEGNNTSQLAWQLMLYSGAYGRINTSVAREWTVKIGNQEYSGTAVASIGDNTTKTLASGYTTVYHNNDGTKSVPVSYSYNFTGITFSGTALGLVSGSDTFEVPRISSRPYVSGQNFTDEGNPVITYSAGSGATKVEVGIAINNADTPQIAYRVISTTGTSYTFNLTDAERNTLRNAIPNSKSMTVRFRLRTQTYYNSTLGVSDDKTFTIVNANPTMSPTAKDTNSTAVAVTGDANNRMIKGFNTMSVAMGAAAVKGATLKSYKITCGSKSISAASGTLTNADSGTITFTATDSRGNTTTKTLTKTLIDYVPLTCNLDADAPSTDGEMSFTVSGNYFNGSFGTTSNTLTVQYRYKVNEGAYGSWTTVTPTISGNTYSVKVNLTGLNYTNQYRFEARATDKLGTVESNAPAVKTRPIFDWGENDFNFNCPVTITDGYVKYPLMGMINAMTKTYPCEVTTFAGENYTVNAAGATICGNMLRCNFSVTRNAATGAGNIANETVLTLSIVHGGKISNMLNVCFSNGANGHVASFLTSNVSQTLETLDFNVQLSATGGATNEFSTYFTVPISLNLDYFVED